MRGDLTDRQDSPFPITAVALSWTGPLKGLRIRFYDASGVAAPWTDVQAGCPCGGDTVTGAGVHRALVLAEDARAFQLSRPADADLLSAVVMDTVHGPIRDLSVPSAPVSPTPSPPGKSAPPDLADLGVILRAGWGADEKKMTAAPVFTKAQALTVHHTVTANDDPDPAATVRAIYEQHAVQNDWGDIGYHFLVDSLGRIYEGRASGNDGVPAHNSAGAVVTGFHTAGFNTGNIGVALLGNMNEAPLTARAERSLTRLLAALAHRHGIDPLAPATFRTAAGRTRVLPSAVNLHRFWTSTECPGSRTNIVALREAAAAEITG
ncbi:peptidoglycan recognition protein family protein [Streptomyces bauhiniae]